MQVSEVVAGEATIVLVTDHAAVRAFENNIDLDGVLGALRSGHFKQPAVELGRFIHYVRVDGRLLKVVTGPSVANPALRAVITILPLDGRNG
jgi:Domain of unknown function (DUF4258)